MTDPGPSAPAFFGAMVDKYDSLIRRAVPRYDEMTTRLIEYLPAQASRIIELGCGTGNLTLQLLRRYPGATVSAVDAAAEMTSLTEERAKDAGVADRLRTFTARFEDVAPFIAQGAADLVTASLSLHHVQGKLPLYKSIRSWLVPGGTLAFADQLLGTTDAIQKKHWDLWLAFCREPGHCTEEEIATLEAHAAAHDHYVSLPDHFDMLTRAGFTDLDCTWRTAMYSVITARAAT
jgi:trans-aconitate methyltransferase